MRHKENYIIYAVTIAIIIISLFSSFNIYRQTKEESLRQFNVSQKLKAIYVSSTVKNAFTYLAQDVSHFAVQLSEEPLDKPEGLKSDIDTFVNNNRQGIDASRFIQATIIRNESGHVIYPANIRQTKTEHLPKISSLKNNAGLNNVSVISTFFYDPSTASGNKDVPKAEFLITSPMQKKMNGKWRCIGSVSFLIDVNNFIESYMPPSGIVSKNDDFFILDDKGNLIYSSANQTMVAKNVLHTEQQCFRCHTSFNTFKEAFFLKEGSGKYDMKDHSMKFAAFVRSDIPSSRLHIVIKGDQEKTTAFISKNFREITGLALFVIIGVIGGSIALSKLNSRRLRLKADAVHMKEMKKAKKEWEDTFDSIKDYIIIVNEDNMISRANRSSLDKFGFNIIGKNISSIIPNSKDNHLETSHILSRKRAGITADEAENEIAISEGTYSVSSYPIYETDKKVNRVVHIMKDITEKKRLKNQIVESEEKYRSLFENAMDGIVIINSNDSDIIDCNDMFETITGYRKDELLGKNIRLLLTESPGAYETYLRCINESPEGCECDITLKNKNSNHVIVEVNSSTLKYSGREAIIIIIKDITEKKELEELLLQAEKMSVLGEMISGIAHELNNPLTGVMGYSELLLSYNLDSKIKNKLEKIHNESLRCRKIVQNLLTFARKHKPERNYIDINRLLKNSIDLKSYDLRVSGIHVNTEFDETLPKTMADPHQLQQVFLNIINNAQYAMLDCEIERVKTLRLRTAQHNGQILISISDNGPGISKQNLRKIFTPFFTTKEPGKGTGLGLSVCYGIIKEHDGEISAGSTDHEGATFTITLPVISKDTSLEYGSSENGNNQSLAAHKNILVIDDDEIVSSLLYDLLKMQGHEVEVARNGKSGIDMIMKSEYDIILCDIKMPVMNGQKVYNALVDIRPDLLSKFLIVTGDTINPNVNQFILNNNIPNIEKPFDQKELLDKINGILAKSCRPILLS